MTLIVARIVDKDLFVAGDSRLLNMDGTTRDPLNGTLKIQLLSPELCMAFAGEISQSVMEELQALTQQNLENSLQEIINELFDLHIRSNMVLDFIVATISPQCSIYKISDGQIITDLQTAFIGDVEAFNEYQKQYHETNHLSGNHNNSDRYEVWVLKIPDHEGVDREVFSGMCNALRSVI